MKKHLRFGIEEEYFITDLMTRQMPSVIPHAAIERCKTALGQCFAHEMFQGQIEAASPIFTHLSQAGDFLAHARSQLKHALEPFGLGVLSGGSHPLGDWPMQHATDQQHFIQLFEDYQRVARRSLVSGLHVHVEIPDHVDRIRVMNEILPWMPLLLALSASSPFWEGADSGFMSYRQAACDEWPRMGIPEFFDNYSAYDAYITFLISSGSIKQPGECWWGVRPSAKYPTLELRMTDACPRLDDALCIASLFRVMVAFAIDQPLPGATYSQKSHWILKENRWRAKRYGAQAAFLIENDDQSFTSEQWLARAEQLLGATAHELGVEQVFSQARHIMNNGTSAERQRHVYHEATVRGLNIKEALSQVVDQLLKETTERGEARH